MGNAPLELVVAASENDVIGRDNRLPWHLPGDLRHFKMLTTGKTILMGRKTHESIGKALPNRVNVVLTREPSFKAVGCLVAATLEEARAVAGTDLPVMVIGGADVYRQCLPIASRIHLTLVHTRIAGDTFFDGWRGQEWVEVRRERLESDEKNAFAYSFVILERR